MSIKWEVLLENAPMNSYLEKNSSLVLHYLLVKHSAFVAVIQYAINHS